MVLVGVVLPRIGLLGSCGWKVGRSGEPGTRGLPERKGIRLCSCLWRGPKRFWARKSWQGSWQAQGGGSPPCLAPTRQEADQGAPRCWGGGLGGLSGRTCHLHDAVSRGGPKLHHLQLGPRAADPAARTSAGCPVDASRPHSAPGLHLTPRALTDAPAAQRTSRSLGLRVISVICAWSQEKPSQLPSPLPAATAV